jgi:hypothetical protein
MNFRRPDVVIGTKDWESVEGFLRNVEPDKMAGLREKHKYHMRIVLHRGEMVPEPAGERDGTAVQDHLDSGNQAGQRERARRAHAF